LALRIIPGIGATFSICGAGFIIFTYFYIGTALQRGHYKLIAFMSFADGMSAFAYLLGLATAGGSDYCNTSAICYIQAMLSQFFEMASMFWVLCISIKVSYIIYNFLYPARMKNIGETLMRWDQNCLQRLCICVRDPEMRLYHLVSWGIPGILCAIAMAGSTFGDVGPWCWIEKEHQWARFACYYVWLLLIMIFDSVMFGIVIWNAKTVRSSDGQPLMAAEPLAYRLRLYLLAFIITKFFSVLNRFYDLASPDNPSFTLNILQSLFEPFTGFCNAMVYGFNKMVYLLYKEKFRRNAQESTGTASASTAKTPQSVISHNKTPPRSVSPDSEMGHSTLAKHDSLQIISDADAKPATTSDAATAPAETSAPTSLRKFESLRFES